MDLSKTVEDALVVCTCCFCSEISVTGVVPAKGTSFSVLRIREPVLFLSLGSGIGFFQIPNLRFRIPNPYF